jgi:zinc transport system substrate-binding protein
VAPVFRAVVAFCALAAFSACSGGKESAVVPRPEGNRQGSETVKPLVVVSILPQAWFVDQVAGDRVRLVVLAGPGQNPHSYEPSPRQMNELAEAKVWILSGSEFEISLRPKIENLFPGLQIVDGTAGVRFRSLE